VTAIIAAILILKLIVDARSAASREATATFARGDELAPGETIERTVAHELRAPFAAVRALEVNRLSAAVRSAHS